MPNAHICKDCKFFYISRLHHFGFDHYVNRCGMMFIVDPNMRKQLDRTEEYCPLKDELERPEISEEFKDKVKKEATLRMYRNGFVAYKNLEQEVLDNCGIIPLCFPFSHLKNKINARKEYKETINKIKEDKPSYE